MVFLKSLALAFSLFSKIPMPAVAWNERNLRYAMCFFPLVGCFIGALVFALFALARFFPAGSLLLPLALALAPLFVTGGIHFDGFLDTCDALASRAPVGKKLEILKDSHVGAFAVLGAAAYLLSYFVLCAELCRKIGAADLFSPGFFAHDESKSVLALSLSFALSRLLSAIAVCAFPKAKNSGLLRTFSDSAAKKITFAWCAVFSAAIFSVLLAVCGMAGRAVCAASIFVFAWYFFMARRHFGGITGDLAGWFVEVCEIFCLLGVCVA